MSANEVSAEVVSYLEIPDNNAIQAARAAAREAGEELVAIDITGNAFLHNMVRTIAGTLVEVGRGHRDPSWVAEVLAACDRAAAGPCAPAKGLTFVGVEYPENNLVPWD